MAQRKLKIGLSSSLVDQSPNVSIWFDNQLIQDNISIPNTINNPYVIEHTFEASGIHSLKITMHNDFFETPTDLNLHINYLMLSDENGIYTNYTYLASDVNVNYRTDDNTNLLMDNIWEAGKSFEFSFDTNNLITWYDIYQYNLDNP